MDAIVRGESAAMEMLYRRYSRLFFCMAYRGTSNTQAAEDLLQVAFLTIWQHRAVYTKDLGGARSWLLSIMRHRILDDIRRWRSRSTWKKIPCDHGILLNACDRLAQLLSREAIPSPSYQCISHVTARPARADPQNGQIEESQGIQA
jgi:RNA polymerase sigma factor (sigma-70 family)